MRVLVIEDDPAISDVLSRGLEMEGFEVDVATNGADGLWRATEDDYVAIVLDLLLPEMNGYEVCRRIREAGRTTPILVLTAKSGDHDQVDLLELGADGFLSKPVTVPVIVANLRALLRRGSSTVQPTHHRGPLTYNEETRTCTLNGEAVALTSRELALLSVLLRATGFMSRNELIRAVWGIDFDGDPGIIDVYIRKLRAKLGDQAIENRRGLGYRIGFAQS